MKAGLKIRLSMLPLLACSTLAFASGPILLNASDMDRVTAGSQSFLQNITNLFAAAPMNPAGLNSSNWISLTSDQLTSIKQLMANEPASRYQVAPGDSVIVYQLKPGEALQIRQTSSGGANYAYIRSTGNASIQIFQVAGS